MTANTTALVTGASSGIGEAYADRLAARGHDLILVARRRDRLDTLADRLRARHGRKVEVHVADLADAADLAGVEALLRERSDIGMLVNNAGLGALSPSVTADADEVETLIRVNILALTRLCLAVAPRFVAQDHGVIVNIGSIIATFYSPRGAAYSGSKAYVLNFSRSLQTEFAGTGVKVQVVMPGPVRSEFFGDNALSFPEEQFMSAETLADAGLAALDQGELVCLPTLHDLGAWSAFDAARTGLAELLWGDGRAAARYATST